MQVPTAMSVIMLPEVVQTEVVMELKATARPDEAEAEIANGAVPIVLPAMAANEIVCAVNAVADTVKDCVTCAAAL